MSYTAIRTINGDILEGNILKQMDAGLNVLLKYSVIPVVMMQFMIERETMDIKVVFTAYDNRSIITEMSSIVPHLESVIYDKLPKSILPAVISYPEGLNYTDVLFNHIDKYWYSSTYIISAKEFKDALKNGKIKINSIDILSNSNRTDLKTILNYEIVPFYKKESEPDGFGDGRVLVIPELMISKMPDTIKEIRLPFSNYVGISKSYKYILNAITERANLKDYIIIEDSEIISEMTEKAKEEQMINIPGLDNVKIFKDFAKIKGSNIEVISKAETTLDGKISIRDVFYKSFMKNSHYNIGIFYRYIDNIYDTVIGDYVEEEING